MSKPNPAHPWDASMSATKPAKTAVRPVEVVAALLRSVAHLTYAEAAAAHGLTVGTVASYVRHARKRGQVVVTRPSNLTRAVEAARAAGVEPRVREPRKSRAPRPPKQLGVVTLPRTPTPVPSVAAFHTGITILDVVSGQCRALDDVGHCCCRPILRGSWCETHRATFIARAA